MSIVAEENRLNEAAQVMDTLASRTAANDDHLSDDRAAKAAAHVEATGGWNAYDVWRRLIKEARERRERDGRPARR